jgi:hypothetical protein
VPGAATAAPVPGDARGIPGEIDPAAAWQHDEAGKHPQMPIIFAVGRDRSPFDDKSSPDRETFRQTVKIVACR